MEARDWEELKKKLCKELDEIKSHKNLDMGDIEVIDKLSHSIKNINKIIDDEDGGYSMARGMRYSRDYNRDGGMWSAEGSYDDGYGRDNSYARRGMHYVRGHYSRAGEDMTSQIEDMMNNSNLSANDRNTLSRALEVLRK